MRIITLLTISFLLAAPSLSAQSASSYIRKIASEQRKIRTKQINYYKTALMYNNKSRLDKGREMILTQIESSERNINRTPPFKGDSAVRNDYGRILKMYEEIYTTMYDSVQTLKATANESDQDLRKYQKAFYAMENMIDDAESAWQANEDYFANTYLVTMREDPTKNELNTFRDLAIYVEDMRSTYANMRAKLKLMDDAVKADSLEVLEDIRQEIVIAAEDASINATTVGEYQWYDEDGKEILDDYLLKAVLDYVQTIKDEADDPLYNNLVLIEEARFDGNLKQEARSKERLEDKLASLEEEHQSLQETIERFVTDIVER